MCKINRDANELGTVANRKRSFWGKKLEYA